jgi:hypothetical protein
MSADYSAVLFLPAYLREAGNQLAAALGHDDADPPDTYNVPLFAIGGGGVPTHFGCHAWATLEFKTLVETAQAGSIPEGLEDSTPVVAGLIASFMLRSEIDSCEHFDAIAAAHGLERREAAA